MNSPNSTERLRSENRCTILRTLRDKGPIARVELSKLTGLSPATISGITRELIEKELLLEQESAERPARGRPRVMVDIRPDAGQAMVATVRAGHIDLSLYNLKGQRTKSKSLALPLLTMDAQVFEAVLVGAIADYLQDNGIEQTSLYGLGLAIQGMVDRDSGRLFWSPILGFTDHALQPALAQAFDCPVELINDANSIALALRSQPRYRTSNNFASIMLGMGVGMGVFINGRLYQGRAGSAAEFGHMVHDSAGPRCRCGQSGCVEAYISDYALLRDCGDIIDATAQSTLTELEQLRQAAVDGNEDVLRWFQRAGHVLGTGISHVINLLAPERVVISTTGLACFEFMQPSMQRAIDAAVTPAALSLTELAIDDQSTDLIADGAARRALSHFYFPNSPRA